MSNTWKNKVLPKIKKLLDKGKKKGASGVCKSFDKSRESLDKEFEEKGADLSPKVVDIYRSSSTFVAKQLLKKASEGAVKENPGAAEGVLQELAKAGFPGAQVISDAAKKYGPAELPGPIVYLFGKASVYLSDEPLPEEPKEEKTREVTVEDVKAAEKPAAEPETSAASAPSEAEASAGKPPPGERGKDEIPKEVEEPKEATGPAAAAELPASTADDPPPAPAAAPVPTPPPADKTA